MATSTTTPTQSDPSVPAKKRGLFGKFELSPTQVVATGFAGVTATFLASYLGVSGTIIGAALVSMTTAVGNAVYGTSLRSGRDKVRDAVPFGKADPASPTVVLPVTEDDDDRPDADPADAEPELPAALAAERAAAMMPARAWRRVAIIAVATFAALLAVVTSVELLAGRPLSDVVRGESGHGTSIGGGGTGSGGSNNLPAGTTTTVTVTPKVVVTTPTVTQTAKPATKTASPTSTTTTTPPATSGTSGSGTSGTPSGTTTTLPRPGD